MTVNEIMELVNDYGLSVAIEAPARQKRQAVKLAITKVLAELDQAKARVAELEAAINDIKQMTSKAASFTRYAYAVREFDGPNHWHDLSEINALCGPKEGKR